VEFRGLVMVGSKVRAGAGQRAKGCPSAAGGRGQINRSAH
jgi:hypothetical protein